MLTKIQDWLLVAELLALKAAAVVSNSLEEQIVHKIERRGICQEIHNKT